MKHLARVITLLAVSTALILSACTKNNNSATAPQPPSNSDEFDFCWYALSALFIYQDRLPKDPYIYATPVALYASVNDPYTKYWDPAQADTLLAELTTETGGIGILIDSVGSGYLVKQVFKNSPGQKAGLLAGDTLQQANGHSLAGVALSDLSSYLGGNIGDIISLTVDRQGTILTIRVTLGTYLAPSVLTDSLDSVVAYIALMQFSDSTVDPLGSTGEFGAALDSTNWAQYTVLDLRDNTGGAVTQCIAIVSQFVPVSTIIIKTQERDVNAANQNGYTFDSQFTAGTGQKAVARKFEVLVNHWTASASEILVNCLRERRQGTIKIIGTQTYGKGSGWTYAATPQSGLVTITKLLLIPVIDSIYNHIGITPDIVIDSTADALKVALSDIGTGGLGKRLAYSDKSNWINRMRGQLPKRPKIPMCIVK